MADISLSTETMEFIRTATNICHVDILDCLVTDDKVIFVVRNGHLGAAIGKKAKNLERLRNLFKKNIKFVEDHPDKTQFIRNLCKPYELKEITFSGSEEEPLARIVVTPADKSKIIGKNGSNIDLIRKLAQRHHNFKDVQIK
jgi:transcription termination/antitermination protein NusA